MMIVLIEKDRVKQFRFRRQRGFALLDWIYFISASHSLVIISSLIIIIFRLKRPQTVHHNGKCFVEKIKISEYKAMIFFGN